MYVASTLKELGNFFTFDWCYFSFDHRIKSKHSLKLSLFFINSNEAFGIIFIFSKFVFDLKFSALTCVSVHVIKIVIIISSHIIEN